LFVAENIEKKMRGNLFFPANDAKAGMGFAGEQAVTAGGGHSWRVIIDSRLKYSFKERQSISD
jgi:hypothetical protein